VKALTKDEVKNIEEAQYLMAEAASRQEGDPWQKDIIKPNKISFDERKKAPKKNSESSSKNQPINSEKEKKPKEKKEKEESSSPRVKHYKLPEEVPLDSAKPVKKASEVLGAASHKEGQSPRSKKASDSAKV